MRGILLICACLALAPAGCQHDPGHDHEAEAARGHEGEHGHGESGRDEGGHGHEGASEVVTRWGASTQLFVEFPALVAGEDSAFAAHLTRLHDHLAIDQGTVEVELSGDGVVERFTVTAPSVAGIFRPVVRPAKAGKRRVTLSLRSPVASEVHDLGEFTVFASHAEAGAAAVEEEDGDSISYLLEQQWKIPFRVDRAEARTMRPNIPAFALLRLPNDAEVVVSAPRDGRLVVVGDRFPVVGAALESGAVLFGLATAPLEQADPASLDLAIAQASIGVSAAQREVDRLLPLVEQGVVARKRLDEATSGLSIAQAELRSARRRKNSLGQSQRIDGNRDVLDVPSPISGTVAEIFVAPGSWVSAGQPLARVADRDRLWLDVGVPEVYVGRIVDVSGAWFHLGGVAGVFELQASSLVSVGIEVNLESRTLPVRFEVDNTGRELFAGMTASAHLVVDEPQVAVAVPLAAVVDDAGTDVVYVQTGGESFERRAVRLGVEDGAHIEVVDGVAVGEWVVSRGAHSVKLASKSTESVGQGHAH